MERVIVSLAAGLGHVLRFIVLAFPRVVRLVAEAMVVYGVALYDVRLGWIAAGVLLLVIMWPRPKEKR